MYTVKIFGPGTIVFRQRDVRVPATFNKVSAKELKFLKVLCRAQNHTYEILEAETERLSRVAEKVHDDDDGFIDVDKAIEETETNIEDLFEGDDTLGQLIDDLNEKE